MAYENIVVETKGRVGIMMSGGLDSTTLAASAVDVSGDPNRVIARCLHYTTLFPDDEVLFATEAARRLGIELRLTALDDALYDPNWGDQSGDYSEPRVDVVRARPTRALNQAMAEEAQVWFGGDGPDNALRFERDAYLSWLVAGRRWRRLAEALWLYLRAKGVSGWGGTFRRYAGTATLEPAEPALPGWLNRDLVVSRALDERWREIGRGPQQRHPWRPQSVASFEDTIWQSGFADCDDDERQAPFVWRHPYFDLRVLHYMLSLPPVPWTRRKLVMRQAMQGRLPDAVVRREKTPLPGDPLVLAARRHRLPELQNAGRLARWVDVGKCAGANMDSWEGRQILAVHAFDHWLRARAA